MTGEDAVAWSLARLNTAFIHHYDRRAYDEVLALFTPDAVHEVRGRALHGHAEIKAALDARPGPELTVRHLVTNLHFHTITDTDAHGSSCLTAYAGPTAGVGPGPLPGRERGPHRPGDRPLHGARRPLEDRQPHRRRTPRPGRQLTEPLVPT